MHISVDPSFGKLVLRKKTLSDHGALTAGTRYNKTKSHEITNRKPFCIYLLANNFIHLKLAGSGK